MTMQFELVTPEASQAQIEATMVVVPGAEGDMGVLQDHAPTVTSLRPGVVSVTGSDGDTSFFVAGGFAEVTAERCTVLAEEAVPVEDIDASAAEERIKAANEAISEADKDTALNAAETELAVAEAMLVAGRGNQ